MLEQQIASLAISEPINVDEDAQMLERIIIPHKGQFSPEECIYLCERFPCTELHPWLLAYRGSRTLPPVFYRGWIIDHEDFWERAVNKGVAVFSTTEWAPHEPNYYQSISRYVRTLLKEIGIKPPVKAQVNLVAGPEYHGDQVRLHLSVQDNYRVIGMLSEEDVDKVRQAFGFRERPRWYISAMDMHWRFVSK